MELDKRIIEGKKPLTCFDIDEAEKYVGKKCYISNEYDFFRDLDFTQPKILNGVEDCEEPFHYDSGSQAEFCLPAEWVKEPEKKYRPFTLDEFVNKYSLGDEIILRPKSDGIICHKLFVEYAEYNDGDDTVYLGSSCYGLTDLYEDCEIYTSEGWKPFGIEE